MAALSSKDKMRLRLSAKRVEKIRLDALKPASNPVDKEGNRKQIRLRGIVFVDKPFRKEEVFHVDKVHTPDVSLRSAQGKMVVRRGGDTFYDYTHDAKDAFTSGSKVYVPAANGPSVAVKGRREERFAKKRNALDGVVIVRKGQGKA